MQKIVLISKFKFTDKRYFLPFSESICDDHGRIHFFSRCPITPCCPEEEEPGYMGSNKRDPSCLAGAKSGNMLDKSQTSDDRPVMILRPRAGDEIGEGQGKKAPLSSLKG